MPKKNNQGLPSSLLWKRVLVMSSILFFVYLGDAVLSDWVPAFMQKALGGPFLMGLVFAFSSVVGLMSDLVFPQLLRKFKARRILLMAIGANLVFSGILIWTTSWSWLVLFLLAMSAWGIYYELIGFGSAQFVSDVVPLESRSSVWAMIRIFKSMAYFIGPVLGSWLLIKKGNISVILSAVIAVVIGYLIWVLTKKRERLGALEAEPNHRFRMLEELGYWKELFPHVWPVLLISLMMGLIDATYWTTGTVLSDNLAKSHLLGGMFLPVYMIPPIFMGVILMKKGVRVGKKKIAEIFLLLAGVFLASLGFKENIYVMLTLSFLVGTALAVAWPMVDAVYTDILTRMGKERKHMVGLSSSMVSTAYIVGPVTAGFVSSQVGERMTFVVVGVLAVLVAVTLLFVTPKKLRLPQMKILEWKD